LRDGAAALDRVCDGVHVHRALVGEVVEHVERLLRGRAALPEPEDQVDPEVQARRDVLAL